MYHNIELNIEYAEYVYEKQLQQSEHTEWEALFWIQLMKSARMSQHLCSSSGM